MEVGTKVISPSGALGIIRDVQEGEGMFARGYWVYFDDIQCTLFMADGTVQPHNDYEVTNNNQIQFKL